MNEFQRQQAINNAGDWRMRDAIKEYMKKYDNLDKRKEVEDVIRKIKLMREGR